MMRPDPDGRLFVSSICIVTADSLRLLTFAFLLSTIKHVAIGRWRVKCPRSVRKTVEGRRGTEGIR